MQQHKSDRWIDYLTAYGYDIQSIYQQLINRIKGDPRKLFQQLQNKTNYLLQIQPKIRTYLQSIQPYTKHQKILQYLLQKLHISQSHIILFSNRYLWHNYQPTKLFNYMQQNKIKIKIKLTKYGEYQIIVFITQGMQQNYKKYGDIVYISYHFVPLKRNKLMRCTYLGILCGINWCGDMVIFGMALVIGSNPQYKGLIIQYWLELVKPMYTFSMVGQYTPYIHQIIKNYNKKHNNKQIYYYQNWYHTLQQAQKSLIAQPSRKHIIILLKKLLLAFNFQQSQQIFRKINRLLTLKQNIKIIPYLLQNTMSLFTKNIPKFIGFQIQANKYNYIAQLVQNQIGYCSKLGIMIYRLLQFQKKINTGLYKNKKCMIQLLIDKYKINGIIHQELYGIVNIMSDQMFKKLFYNYYLAIQCCKLVQTNHPLQIKIYELLPIKPQSQIASSLSQVQLQNNSYSYNYSINNNNDNNAYHNSYTNYQQSSNNNYNNNNNNTYNSYGFLQFPQNQQIQQTTQPSQPDQYVIKYSIKYNCWECSCKMIYWAGIPCSHLIHTILYNKGSIKYYINTRWLAHGQSANKENRESKDRNRVKDRLIKDRENKQREQKRMTANQILKKIELNSEQTSQKKQNYKAQEEN